MKSVRKSLHRGFGGEVVEPGAAEYESARRSVFASGSPAYVLRPRSVADVETAVRFACRAGLVLSVRGGGHGFPGFATNDGGVVIDLSQLASVEIVDEERHLVRIGGGATWGQVAAALAPHRLAISSGDTKSVGVGGLTLTGGMGWKVRKYGLALDSVVAATVVLANGTVVEADARENPDLFWALRGGGGNFGIVTSFDFAAHPTTDVFYGKITYSASAAAGVLQGWAEYLRSAPDELTSVVTLAKPQAGGPEAPLEINVVFDGDDAERAAGALDPIRCLGTVTDDDVALTSCADTLVDGAIPPPGLRFMTRSAFVGRDSVPEVLQILAEVAALKGSPAIGIRSVTGAASRVPSDATAYAHRRAELMISTLAAGPEPAVQAAEPALDAIWARLAAHVNGAYANFLTSATEADIAAIYPADTFRRLVAIKRRYDPGNLFAGNHNIPPSLSRSDDTSDSPSLKRQPRSPVPAATRPAIDATSTQSTAQTATRAAS